MSNQWQSSRCPMSWVLCPVSCALCPCALCPVYCVLCPVSSGLCPWSCVLLLLVPCVLCLLSLVLCPFVLCLVCLCNTKNGDQKSKSCFNGFGNSNRLRKAINTSGQYCRRTEYCNKISCLSYINMLVIPPLPHINVATRGRARKFQNLC